MPATTCAESSLAAGEPLAGTATRAERWLLVETRGAWERDVSETELAADVRAVADEFEGRVLMIRRPDRRDGEPAVFVAETSEHGGTLRRLTTIDDPTGGELLSDPLVLVCCHGRRDACCARFGPSVFDALDARLPPDRLWQSSHLGGHRFAANVLVLPAGVLLGRVTPADAARIAAAIAVGMIPLDRYRGRTIHAPEAQAADAAARERYGLTRLGDARVLSAQDGRVRLATSVGELDVGVDVEDGPPLSESCGKEPAPSIRYSVRW